ncbi:hypothetical protein [Candidatus Uabimicrobium sp. HlEnr_7]|uniref:HAMP domain-containing protein n=1 Tax=Candidatus Uabimicrobium helgolandensis TaxID=3095367 RepID=UPI003559123A
MNFKIEMHSLEFYAVIGILLGALIMIISIAWVKKIREIVPQKQIWKWKVLATLMGFFFIGYIMLTLLILYQLPVNRDILTSLVFLGGAVFVFIVMDVSHHTIKQILNMDQLKELNDELEQQKQHLSVVNQNLQDTIEDVLAFSKIANEVSQGNFDIEIPEMTKNKELASLSGSFSRMLESLKIAMNALDE